MPINEPFEKELTALINKYSMENGSNTPDFILASYMAACLQTWNIVTTARDRWYDGHLRGIGGTTHPDGHSEL